MVINTYTVAENKVYTPSGGYLPIPASFSLYDTSSDLFGEEEIIVSSSQYTHKIYHARRPGFISRWRITDNAGGYFSDSPVIRRYGIEKSIQTEEWWREYPDNVVKEVLNNPRFGGAVSGSDMYPSFNIYYDNWASGSSGTIEGAVIPLESANFGNPYSRYSNKGGNANVPSLRWTNKQYQKTDVNWSGIEGLHRITSWSFQPSAWGSPYIVDAKNSIVINLVSGFDSVSSFDLSSGYVQNYTSALSSTLSGYTTKWTIGYYYTTSTILDRYNNMESTTKTLHILYPSQMVGVIFERSVDGLCFGLAAWNHFDSENLKHIEQIEFGYDNYSSQVANVEDSDTGPFLKVNSASLRRDNGWTPNICFFSIGTYSTVKNNLDWLASSLNIYHRPEPVVPSSVIFAGYLPYYTYPMHRYDSMRAFYIPVSGTNNNGVEALLRFDREPGYSYFRHDDYGNVISAPASYVLEEQTSSDDPMMEHTFSSVVGSSTQAITYADRMPQVNFWRTVYTGVSSYDEDWMHRWDCADLAEYWSYGNLFTILQDSQYIGWMGGYAVGQSNENSNYAFKFVNPVIYSALENFVEGDTGTGPPFPVLKAAMIPIEWDGGGYAYQTAYKGLAINNKFTTSGYSTSKQDYAGSRAVIHWAIRCYQITEPNYNGYENIHKVTWWTYIPEELNQDIYTGLYSLGAGLALASSLSSFEVYDVNNNTAYELPSSIIPDVGYYNQYYGASYSGTNPGNTPGRLPTGGVAPHYFSSNYVAMLATKPSNQFCVALIGKIASSINNYARPTVIGVGQQEATRRFYDGLGAKYGDHLGPIMTINGNSLIREKGWAAFCFYIYTGRRSDINNSIDLLIGNNILESGIPTNLPAAVTSGTIPPSEVFGSYYTEHL